MSDEAVIQREVNLGDTSMTRPEAIVEILVAKGITDVFGFAGWA